MSKYDVIAVGNAIVDILAFESKNFLDNNNIEKGIMTLTDRKTVDKLAIGTINARRISGGSVANTAVGIASLGGKSAFIGKVANDDMGRLFTKDINENSVAFSANYIKNSDESTACSYIIVTPDADRTMLTYLGVAANLELSDIDENLIADSKICYLEGYLWDDINAISCIKRAIKYAKKHNREVSFSLSDPFCVDRHRDEFLKLVQNDIDILFANESEITSLYKVNTLDEAISRVSKDCKIAAITLGKNGSIIINGDEVTRVKAVNVKTIVDTTGAGDLYAAGFLYGYTNEKTLEEAAKIASISAGEIISHLGARPEEKLSDLFSC